MADKASKTPKPKLQYYYDIKVESVIPAIITYRVLAESPEQAVELLKGKSPSSVQHKLVGRKDKKLTVYESGCTMIKLIKNLISNV